MMKRRIFLWMGLIVLIFSFGIGQEIQAGQQYTIKRGDTLAGIAKKTGVSIKDLKDANHLQSATIKAGQTLHIPRQSKKNIAKPSKIPSGETSYYIVKKGDTLYSIAKRAGLKVHDLSALNHIRSRSLKIGQKLVLTTPRFETPVEPVGNDAGEEADLSGAEYSEEDDLGPFDEDDVYWIQFEEDDEGNADLIGKWNSPEERRLFVKVVRGFLGAPYRPGGNSIRGLDCSAFVKKIYKFFDVDLPATAYEQAHVGLSIERESLEEGDLVFFNTGCAYGHVGIYIGNNEFIHASPRDRRVKVESLDSPYYDKRFIKAVRLKELETEV